MPERILSREQCVMQTEPRCEAICDVLQGMRTADPPTSLDLASEHIACLMVAVGIQLATMGLEPTSERIERLAGHAHDEIRRLAMDMKGGG